MCPKIFTLVMLPSLHIKTWGIFSSHSVTTAKPHICCRHKNNINSGSFKNRTDFSPTASFPSVLSVVYLFKCMRQVVFLPLYVYISIYFSTWCIPMCDLVEWFMEQHLSGQVWLPFSHPHRRCCGAHCNRHSQLKNSLDL